MEKVKYGAATNILHTQYQYLTKMCACRCDDNIKIYLK